MKTLKKLSLALSLPLIASMCLFIGCNDDHAVTPDLKLKSTTVTVVEEPIDCSAVSNYIPTAEEVDMINAALSYEIMALDVYNFVLGQDFKNKNIFTRIAESEQAHVDKLYCLIDYFDLTFIETDLSEDYASITALATGSFPAALDAGIALEEMLGTNFAAWAPYSENSAIRSVFTNLANASDNHLSSLENLSSKFE